MTESVCESITLTSFSIICQHCRREIKRTQFPLQMHGVNLLLSLRARLKPTHPESSNVMFLFWACYVKEPFYKCEPRPKEVLKSAGPSGFWSLWHKSIHFYGFTLLVLDTFMQTLSLEELLLSGVTLLWNIQWLCKNGIEITHGEGVEWECFWGNAGWVGCCLYSSDHICWDTNQLWQGHIQGVGKVVYLEKHYGRIIHHHFDNSPVKNQLWQHIALFH